MTFKYMQVKLRDMTYTFKCTNEKCNKTLICILSKYDDEGNPNGIGRCEVCKSGRLEWIKDVDLFGVLREHKIIHKFGDP
mgnify:FL=1|tara:strand:+ start:244 stop:483 length:240 start_codon:yes stop_codon:yes gene_type:complete